MSKTIKELIEEVTEQICDKYCKYPDQYGSGEAGQIALYEEHCQDCPLDRLGVFSENICSR